ncbi:MAG TPA: glycosyltransferase [Pyrinomonadaceae bacterium]|jgi:hypothetical protein
MKILTWHVHGNYLLYLTRFSPHEFFLPVEKDGAGGRGATFPFGANVKEIAAGDVRREKFDCVLYQHERNWKEDRRRVLSAEQRRLPQIYLEHDPPLAHPTEQKHAVAGEKNVLLVHCTHFNDLMWDAGEAETRVIEHGVFLMSEARANFETARGVTAINHIAERGRRAGGELWRKARARGAPLDLVGMETEKVGGLGEIFPPALPKFLARYRFYFNASVYTSLNLAMIEAMLVGLPVVAPATTEVATVIENGVSGFADTSFENLLRGIRELAENAALARDLGANARRRAAERFDIRRFTADWNAAFAFVTGNKTATAITGGI